MPELYDHILSDRSYTVRLALSLLQVDCTRKTVDYNPAHTPPSTALGADLPLFVDGDSRLSEPAAILSYLARTYDPDGAWMPRDQTGAITTWLVFAGGPLAAVSSARAMTLFDAPGDRDAMVARARLAIREIEDHLTDQGFLGNHWIVGNAPTLADIAIFPAIALSHDCGIGHEDYPAINLWQRHVRRLPHFLSMPGIPDYF